jgi:ubiquinone/menaquinone biosynthesis C-methylase UbiE
MRYKNILLFGIISIFCLNKIYAQKLNIDSITIEKQKLILSFLDLKETDKVVDIGTGNGYSLIPIASEYPTLKFTVEDIDSSTCNKKNLEKRIKKLGNKTSIEQFKIVYGTELTTNLPTEGYNKILLFDVIHEISQKEIMLGEIKRITSKGGFIFIEEILVHKPQKKDRICSYPFLTEDEFKRLMIENKFLLVKEQITGDYGKNRYLKIFQYKL